MIIQAFAISLIVLFWHATTWDGMINQWIKKVVPPKGMLYKPLYGCPICCCPYYGSALYWLIYGYSWQDWLITIGVASGFSVLWVLIIDIKDNLK